MRRSPLLELMGFSADPIRGANPIPRLLFWALLITIGAFYASNTFNSPLSQFLFTGKWLPLAVLCAIALGMLTVRRVPSMPVATVLSLAVLFVVACAGTVRSVDREFSILSIVTISATIVAAYAISAVLVANGSRRAFFNMIAIYGRVMVVMAVICMIFSINLGRGDGLSAWTDNPNTLGAMLAPPVIIFYANCIERRPGWQVWDLVFLVVGLYLIWATNARATIVWLFLSFGAFWIYRQGPKASLIAVMLAAIVIIGWWFPIKTYVIETLGLNNRLADGISPLSGREEVWRIGVALFEQRPLLGYGIGSSQDLLRAEAWRFVRHQGFHFHSSYIMMIVETGLFGLFAMLSTLLLTMWRGLADSARTRVLPSDQWPTAALPFALVVGSMGHALFESWLFASGNGNMLLFWTWVWMIHHQAGLRVRAMVKRPVPPPAEPRFATSPATQPAE